MTAPWPFSMWGMDVIGPINPKASNGHMFILVAIDYFTKWIEAITLASVTAKAVARFLRRDVIARYGVPATIITDNAKNLNNKVIDELCAQFKIRHRNSTPYRPQMNGAVEVANKNIKKIIEKMTARSGTPRDAPCRRIHVCLMRHIVLSRRRKSSRVHPGLFRVYPGLFGSIPFSFGSIPVHSGLSRSIWVHPGLFRVYLGLFGSIPVSFGSIPVHSGLSQSIRVHPGLFGSIPVSFGSIPVYSGFPEGRFSGRKRLPANVRGTLMENRDHSDPRTPRDIPGTLRKPRSQVPRSPPTNGRHPRAPDFNNVPFPPTTLPSRAITFKGFLITPTLPREEVVTVRGPIHRAQLLFHPFPLYRVLCVFTELSLIVCAVVRASVPTSFSPSCRYCLLSDPVTHSVRTRMWTLVGASIARFMIARLGSVHLLVGTLDGHA
ncbi:hypothetical protein CRG98_037304 [Punica granatum]|uniref:Integrase catalytic domain-containing protein n=1 Tax=Punica granatum TaxID=22663 RepID=A0A2I0IE69_PUNGR|nr:hypothetical protein CRG98_037304 [Punica granatum]